MHSRQCHCLAARGQSFTIVALKGADIAQTEFETGGNAWRTSRSLLQQFDGAAYLCFTFRRIAEERIGLPNSSAQVRFRQGIVCQLPPHSLGRIVENIVEL